MSGFNYPLVEWTKRDPMGAARLLMGKVTARELVAEKPEIWREVKAAARTKGSPDVR